MEERRVETLTRELAAELREGGPRSRARVVAMLGARGLTEAEAMRVVTSGLASGVLRRSERDPLWLDAT